MLNIVCFKWGTKFPAYYVNRLYRAIERNVTVPFKFICFTEDPEGIDCETRPFLEPLPYWWYIIGLMNPKHNFQDRVVYFDLDTVIIKNIDKLITVDAPIVTIQDFYRPKGLQTAYISYTPEAGAPIWDCLARKYKPETYDKLLKFPGGTNAFLEKTTKFNVVKLQDLFPGACVSYKVHVQNKQLPEEAKIVFFHGKPMPHEVWGMHPWMVENWK